METLTSILSMPAVQSAVIAALSHVVLWAAKKVPAMVGSLPGGYSATKRALATKLISLLGGVPAPTPAATVEKAPTTTNMPL